MPAAALDSADEFTDASTARLMALYGAERGRDPARPAGHQHVEPLAVT